MNMSKDKTLVNWNKSARFEWYDNQLRAVLRDKDHRCPANGKSYCVVLDEEDKPNSISVANWNAMKLTVWDTIVKGISQKDHDFVSTVEQGNAFALYLK